MGKYLIKFKVPYLHDSDVSGGACGLTACKMHSKKVLRSTNVAAIVLVCLMPRNNVQFKFDLISLFFKEFVRISLHSTTKATNLKKINWTTGAIKRSVFVPKE